MFLKGQSDGDWMITFQTQGFAHVNSAAGLTVALPLPVVSSLIILVQVEFLRQIHGLRLRSLVLLSMVGVHFILIKLPLERSNSTGQTEKRSEMSRTSASNP